LLYEEGRFTLRQAAPFQADGSPNSIVSALHALG
jgi:hypothetical protein